MLPSVDNTSAGRERGSTQETSEVSTISSIRAPSRLQILTVQSEDADTSCSPLGLKHIIVTALEWPWNLNIASGSGPSSCDLAAPAGMLRSIGVLHTWNTEMEPLWHATARGTFSPTDFAKQMHVAAESTCTARHHPTGPSRSLPCCRNDGRKNSEPIALLNARGPSSVGRLGASSPRTLPRSLLAKFMLPPPRTESREPLMEPLIEGLTEFLTEVLVEVFSGDWEVLEASSGVGDSGLTLRRGSIRRRTLSFFCSSSPRSSVETHLSRQRRSGLGAGAGFRFATESCSWVVDSSLRSPLASFASASMRSVCLRLSSSARSSTSCLRLFITRSCS
mmetsp:Transcript_36271/g.96407  ORF Transcript_36271/g.96407 Transcript_36271/m.96407 type:complete len:335 (+) Transcript_36271:884-1888(+)